MGRSTYRLTLNNLDNPQGYSTRWRSTIALHDVMLAKKPCQSSTTMLFFIHQVVYRRYIYIYIIYVYIVSILYISIILYTCMYIYIYTDTLLQSSSRFDACLMRLWKNRSMSVMFWIECSRKFSKKFWSVLPRNTGSDVLHHFIDLSAPQTLRANMEGI